MQLFVLQPLKIARDIWIFLVKRSLINISCLCRGLNELKNLSYLPRASEPRENLVEDRTRCHADHVGHGFDRMTTAAVGMLKAVKSEQQE